MTTDAGPWGIRPISVAEFDGFHAVFLHAFNSAPASDELRQRIISRVEFDRSVAAFDGGMVVGTAGAYTFRLTVPGQRALPAAGVTWVAVLPSHRRRGVLSAMMRHQLADVASRGEPLAVLWASEAAIYPRFGYGRGMWQADFTLNRGEGVLAGTVPADPALRIRIAEPAAALPELAKVYDAVLPSRPGFIARTDTWWQREIFDPAEWRQGASPLRCVVAEDDSGPRGYALYSAIHRWDHGSSLPNDSLTVRELVGTDAAARAALAAHLLSRDLTAEFRFPDRPVDDPLLSQLADPRRARPRLTDGLWVRIVDVPAALAGRRYAAPVDVVLEVRDELRPANAGRWRLATTAPAATGWSGGTGSGGTGLEASCVAAEPGAPADVTLGVTELGAAYLGGTRLGELAGAGLVAEGRPGAIRELSTALAWDPAPWCPVHF
jgi:predicted acetyltransferase